MHNITVFYTNIGRYDGNNSAERVHWTKTQSNTCNLIFNTQNPTGRCKFCVFFFGTLKLGFCPIITIITSGFHFSCREYIFLKFFFSLIFVTFVVYMLCHQKMDLSVLCILAFEWVVHGNRYALNNRKAFYWLWNRSYISFPLISLPIPEHYMLAELHLYIELMGFFSRFSAPFSCFHEW